MTLQAIQLSPSVHDVQHTLAIAAVEVFSMPTSRSLEHFFFVILDYNKK